MSSRLPEFPLDAFPISAMHFCHAVAENTQTPTELVAMAMLGALSTVALGAQVDVGNGWTEELALYTMVVMGAGERKSTVMKHVTKPLREIERQVQVEEAEAVREEQARRAVFEHRRRHLLQKYGKEDDNEKRAELWTEIKDVDNQLALIGDPAPFRLLADDVTAEGLTWLLTRQGRIGILAAEGSAIDNIVGARYSTEGTAAKLDIVLKAYSGEPHTVDRRGRESEHAERPLLAICLAIQPDYLAGLIDNSRSRSLGLVSRFAFVTPNSRAGGRDSEPESIDPFFAESWAKTLSYIHTLLKGNRCRSCHESIPGSTGSTSLNKGVDTSSSLSLDPSAREALRQLQQEIEPKLGPGGELAHIADWASRHIGRIIRLAGILHLAERKTFEEPIALETLYRANEIAEFLMAHGRNALEEPDTATLRARQVFERWEADTISVRDLYRQVFHARGKMEQAAKLAIQLVEEQLLEFVPLEKRGRGKQPSPQYKILRSQL